MLERTPPPLLDVNTFIGGYPYRHVPHPEPEILVRVLAREGIARAWVGSLPGAFHRDPSAANVELYRAVSVAPDVLRPAPTLRPDWPHWECALQEAVDSGAAAVRCYPQLIALGVGDLRLAALAGACAAAALPLLLTIRFEDVRQRHSADTTPELSAAHVRELARARTGVRLVVTAAGREFIEEVHWGLTAEERSLLFWDISWLWGPPVDELSQLFRNVGADRFVYGSMWPLRLVQGPRANLALLAPDVAGAVMAEPGSWSKGRGGS